MTGYAETDASGAPASIGSARCPGMSAGRDRHRDQALTEAGDSPSTVP